MTETEVDFVDPDRTLFLTEGRYLYRGWYKQPHTRLTPCEATILTTIAARQGGIATTEELMQALFGKRGVDEYPPTNNVSVHIWRLRKKRPKA